MRLELLVLIAAMSVALGTAYSAEAPVKSTQVVKPADAENDAQLTLLWDARRAIDAGKIAEAMPTIEKVIGYYESKYPEGKQRWFVARTTEEALLYMGMSAADDDKGSDKRSAAALYAIAWSDAYYLKGYALVESGQPADAKTSIEHAIRLSPYNSQYSSELGNIYQTAKNWPKALEVYGRAEAAAEFSPADQKVNDSTRAKRGLGFVLVELGRMDEAESKYKECLVLDPTDTKAQQELEYVRTVRAKNK